MKRGLTGTILCALLAGGVGIGLFFIKHEVKEQEARLAEINDEIQRNQEEVHVLKAEWSYLNDPARLRALSEKHLAMKVMAPNQIASLDSLSRRGLPMTALALAKPAAPAPAPVVAKAEPVKTAPIIAKAEPLKAKPAAKPAPVAAQAVKPAQPKFAQAPAKVAPVAAAPVKMAQAPVPAAAPVAAAAPARTILIQSPALAQTPGLPGEMR